LVASPPVRMVTTEPYRRRRLPGSG